MSTLKSALTVFIAMFVYLYLMILLYHYRLSPTTLLDYMYFDETKSNTYDELFYHNRDESVQINIINKTRDIMVNFTKCEQKNFGYNGSLHQLYFSVEQFDIIICQNQDYENDLRHSFIGCYKTQYHDTHICVFKNIYGFIDNDQQLKFKAFCKFSQSDKIGILNDIKSSFLRHNKYPLYIDLILDENIDAKTVENGKYFDLNNIWFYDNDNQCISHKQNDHRQIGNPWHCWGHLEYWFSIAITMNLFKHKYNMTMIMSKFSEYQFDKTVPIYHFYTPFFDNIINNDQIRSTVTSDNLIYIKQLIIDERYTRGYGAASIWNRRRNFHKIFRNCTNNNSFRSPIYYEMRSYIINYYETNEYYSKYDWIQEIKGIKSKNEWFISNANVNINNYHRFKIIFIATRWINGVCRHRCLSNIKELRARFIEYFSLINNDYVIIYGNPGTLSFMAQYNLFKNLDGFIAVHGAAYLMAALFMKENKFKFEITMYHKYIQTSEQIMSMLGSVKSVSYNNYFCQKCLFHSPSAINIDNVINTFNQSFISLMYK